MVSEVTWDSSTELKRSWLEKFLANRPLLFRLVSRIVRPDDIEDIVQETFILSYAAACKKSIENPRAFMLKTAKNIALNHVTRIDKKLICSIEDIDNFDLYSHRDSVESRYQSEERFLAFCRAVSALPVSCRKVFILAKVYGLTQPEVSDYLGISLSTVEKHVSKGMLLTMQFMLRKGHSVGEASEEDNYYQREEVTGFE